MTTEEEINVLMDFLTANEHHRIHGNVHVQGLELTEIENKLKHLKQKDMKNFKYKLAISNYDQDLIDWCVGIGYKEADMRKIKDNSKYLINNWRSDDATGHLGIYQYTKEVDYIIDYAKHPELTKRLLASVNDGQCYIDEYVMKNSEYHPDFTTGKIYNILDKRGSELIIASDSGKEYLIPHQYFHKQTFDDFLERANCKLSGKEIVSKKKIEVCDILNEIFGKDHIISSIFNENTTKKITHEDISQRMAKLKKQTRKLIKERNKLIEQSKRDSIIAEICDKYKYEITGMSPAKGSFVATDFDPNCVGCNKWKLSLSCIVCKDNNLHSDKDWKCKSLFDIPTIIQKNIKMIVDIDKKQKLDRLRTERDRIKSKYYGMLEFPFGHGLSDFSSREWNTKLSRLWTNLNNIEKKLNKECDLFDIVFEIPYEKIDFPKYKKNLDELVKAAQELGKAKKPTLKPIRFKCRNKDCNHYSNEFKSNCKVLKPTILNVAKGAKCRDYNNSKSEHEKLIEKLAATSIYSEKYILQFQNETNCSNKDLSKWIAEFTNAGIDLKDVIKLSKLNHFRPVTVNVP